MVIIVFGKTEMHELIIIVNIGIKQKNNLLIIETEISSFA